jgi:hypothetical protein
VWERERAIDRARGRGQGPCLMHTSLASAMPRFIVALDLEFSK